MVESASCGLDSDLGFMKCCGMRTVAHECLVSSCRMQCLTVLETILLQGGSKFMFLLNQLCQQYWPKTSVPEGRCSRHENQTDADMRFGWFQHKGLAALVPKPACRVWSGIFLPNAFPLTGSSTSVPSGNGGEENSISVSATAHVESSPQSNWRSAKTSRREW